MTTNTLHGGCPVVHVDTGEERIAGEWIAEFRRLRETGPVLWNAELGFWILTDSDYIREAFQNPGVFTSDSVRPTDPNPPYKLIPSNINPPKHVQYRQILNYAFGPAAVRRIAPRARQHCIDAVEAVADKGSCELMNEVAGVFPSKVFLELIQLPWGDAPLFQAWTDTIFEGIMSGRDVEAAVVAMDNIKQYFEDAIRERERVGVGTVGDFLDHMLTARIDDQPVSRDDVLNMYNQLTMAGLDTVKSAFGYSLWHLAQHPEQRRQIVEQPEIIPSAVEEMLRAFPLVFLGRKLSQDIDFHGAQMKEGQMVMLALPAAMRDPNFFDQPDEIVLDREVNPHYSFGAGPHRCLGSHLARLELTMAFEEWHRRIPDYRLGCPPEQVIERGGQLSLRALPLEWDPQ